MDRKRPENLTPPYPPAHHSLVLTLDKRIAPRYRAGPTDYAVFPDGAGGIRDISVGGVFINSSDPLPVGTPIRLQLNLGTERLDLEGLVRRAVPRQGMGIQFQSIPPETKQHLERCLTNLARATDKDAARVQSQDGPASPPPADQLLTSPEAAGVSGPNARQDISTRVEKLTCELRELEEAVKSSDVDFRVLDEFRASVDQIRQTTWAVQQWLKLQAQKDDAYTVLALIAEDRVRRATQLGKDLVADIEASEVTFETKGLNELCATVEGLYRRLMRFFK